MRKIIIIHFHFERRPEQFIFIMSDERAFREYEAEMNAFDGFTGEDYCYLPVREPKILTVSDIAAKISKADNADNMGTEVEKKEENKDNSQVDM